VQLRVLDLSSNEIQMLEAKLFTFLTGLVKLDLSNNRISQISPDVFLQERLIIIAKDRFGKSLAPKQKRAL